MSGLFGSRRRRIDTAVAALLAVLVLVFGLVVYLTSDARATTLNAGPDLQPPTALSAPPATLIPVWSLTTSPEFPAVASPYGTVVTADDHTVTGHDAVTGAVRWSYGRSNLPLCAVGSGDTDADGISMAGAVRGILTGYVKSGRCSEITSLNPVTGERLDQRTGFTDTDSSLVFGGPYGGLVSDDLVELWRYDLVRTIQYGNQPEPTKPDTKHLGCDFTDVALTGTQFGTIEHCGAVGPNAQLVLNYDDPGATTDGKAKNWDALNYDPRTTVDLGTEHARLVSISSEEAAVLVASPAPAVVVYDAKGTETSRTPVDIPADQIIAADDGQQRVTPVVIADNARYALIGTSLIAVKNDGLQVLWTLPSVLGRPAVVGSQLLVPTTGGLAVVAADTGVIASTIPVNRAGYPGRVDVATVGNTVVEFRGTEVIGLRDPAAPASDTPPSSSGQQIPSRVRIPGFNSSAPPATDSTS